MKNIPNILSISRIILAIVLIFLPFLSIEFYVIYAIAGSTDFLDGFLARRFKTNSKFGSFIDSLADIALCLITALLVLPYLKLPTPFLIWIIIIFVLKIIAALITTIRFKCFFIGHTILNKLTGVLLFILVFFLEASGFTVMCFITCLFASLAIIDEILINASCSKIDLNRKSFFV